MSKAELLYTIFIIWIRKLLFIGCLGGLDKRLLLAHVMILGSWDQAPHQAPWSEASLLLTFPQLLPPACSLSLSNKQIESLITKGIFPLINLHDTY